MPMKAIVADDDKTSRTLMARLVERYLGVQVVESAGGLATLALIEEAQPDVLLVDVELADIDGIDTLRAIRSSATFADLVAVATARSVSRPIVDDLIALGVRDILVKPYDLEQVQRRVTRVLSQVRPARRGPAASPDRLLLETAQRQRLLLVDGDANFRRFAKPLMTPWFDVDEVASGAAALRAVQERTYAVVGLGEHLDLLQGEFLARAMLRNATGPLPRIVRVASEDVSDTEGTFGERLPRSWIPEQFARDFRRIVAGEVSLAERIRAIPSTQLDVELGSALQQTCGVLMSAEASLLAHPPAAGPSDLRTRLVLTGPEGSTEVAVTVGVSQQNATRLADLLGCGHPSLSVSPEDVMREVVNTVAGRIQESMQLRGLDLRMSLPSQAAGRDIREGVSVIATAALVVADGIRVDLTLGVDERDPFVGDVDASVELF